MLRIADLTLARGARRLLEGASLAVHDGHKVGLVGANGAGKSSLFAALRGELVPDGGIIDLPPRWTIAHVAQETPPVDEPALEFVLDGDAELRAIEAALAAAGMAQGRRAAAHPTDAAAGNGTAADYSGGAESATDALAERDAHVPIADDAPTELDAAALGELQHRFEVIGGYSARARAGALLAGLGFAPARHLDAVSSFSGGWRMRLNLAQALMCRSDLLLLDEPTNHLDLDAVLWLEDWLARYPGTLLLITHDRDFLDRVVDTIVHFDGTRLRTYSGNYSQFERQRAEALALQQAEYAKQQRRIAHLQSYVERFRAKATKARQAQSRIKALERMEMIAAAHVDSPFVFEFAPTDVAARQLLRLEHAELGYDGKPPVMANVDWSVLAGARIGLLGPNGAGKSTLLKAIAGVLPPRAGTRWTAQQLRLGYFAQHQVEQLRVEHSALWHLQRLEPATREQEFRDFLGGFDFRGDRALAPVGELSGGEKARLTLALLVRERPNLLLLDEPTNHLDIEMREALTEALQDYDGALLVVAHDRHLLRATTDELWLVHDGRVAQFDGDLDDYREWVLGQRRQDAAKGQDGTTKADASAAGAAVDRKAQKRLAAQARQQRADARRPMATRQAAIEQELAALTAEKEALDAWLATPEAYTEAEKPRLLEATERTGALTWTLARLEAEWLELAEALERLDQPT